MPLKTWLFIIFLRQQLSHLEKSPSNALRPPQIMYRWYDSSLASCLGCFVILWRKTSWNMYHALSVRYIRSCIMHSHIMKTCWTTLTVSAGWPTTMPAEPPIQPATKSHHQFEDILALQLLTLCKPPFWKGIYHHETPIQPARKSPHQFEIIFFGNSRHHQLEDILQISKSSAWNLRKLLWLHGIGSRDPFFSEWLNRKIPPAF